MNAANKGGGRGNERGKRLSRVYGNDKLRGADSLSGKPTNHANSRRQVATKEAADISPPLPV